MFELLLDLLTCDFYLFAIGLITQSHFEESSTFLVKGDAITMLSVQVQSLTHLKKHLPVLLYGMCMNQKT
ncbi:hypothetical protein ACB092_12G041300 [Castanea dentata]